MRHYGLHLEEETTVRDRLNMASPPKFNKIEIEMLKEISKTSRMDIQKTLHRLLEVVYMDLKLRKQIFSRK